MATDIRPQSQWPEGKAAAATVTALRIVEGADGVLVWTTGSPATHAFDDDGANTLTLEAVATVASAARLRMISSTVMHIGG